MMKSTVRSVSRVLAAAIVAACASEKADKAATDSTAAAANAPKNVTLTAEQRQRIQLVTVQPVSFRPVV